MEALNVLWIVIGVFGLLVSSFAGIWFLVTRLLRALAGMTRELDVATGRLLRASAWGSGSVNGVRARGCLRLTEYERGWVVRLSWLFGNGKLWLPKDGVRVGAPQPGGLFRPPSRTIQSGKDRVRLDGTLAAFFDQGIPAGAGDGGAASAPGQGAADP